MDLQPNQTIGDYLIQRKLAEGGMAEVYLATKQGAVGFQKLCALKRVKLEYRKIDWFMRSFEDECRRWAKLTHSSIVQVFDCQYDPERALFLAMELVDGCSLDRLRKAVPGETKVLPVYLAASIARDMTVALAYAFRKLQLIHRDVSPQNVLISADGEAKLTDFGIAKPLSEDTTGAFRGKVAYMAPEQAKQDAIDQRTDIFSLGAVLYELCTGVRPFTAPTDISMITLMATLGMQGKPSRAPDAGREHGVHVELAAILATALEVDPANRFQTADEFGRALSDFLRLAPSQDDLHLRAFYERVAPNLVEAAQAPRTIDSSMQQTTASTHHQGLSHSSHDRPTQPVSAVPGPGEERGTPSSPISLLPPQPRRASSENQPQEALNSPPPVPPEPLGPPLARPSSAQADRPTVQVRAVSTSRPALQAAEAPPSSGLSGKTVVIAGVVMLGLGTALSAALQHSRAQAAVPAMVINVPAAPTPTPASPTAQPSPAPAPPTPASAPTAGQPEPGAATAQARPEAEEPASEGQAGREHKGGHHKREPKAAAEAPPAQPATQPTAPPAPAPAPAAPAPSPAPVVAAGVKLQEKPTTDAEPTALGSAVFHTDDFANLSIDGHKAVELTRDLTLRLPVGHHQAVFEYEGQTSKVDFEVTEKRTAQVSSKF